MTSKKIFENIIKKYYIKKYQIMSLKYWLTLRQIQIDTKIMTVKIHIFYLRFLVKLNF